MQKLLTKVAPLGIMTACVIWCCWSQIRESTPLLAATAAKLPSIERAMLHPEMSPVSDRDPFLQYQPEPPPAIAEIEVPMEVPEEPPFNPQTVLPSIHLDGTMLGSRPLAVINGKIHSQGAVIVLEAAPDVYVRLDRVLLNEIVVTIEEELFHISYSSNKRTAEGPASLEEAAELPNGLEGELPEGTPTPEEIDLAVADSLAQQAMLPNGNEDSLNSEETDASHDDEECEYDDDLLITNQFDEFLNDDE